MNNYSDYLVLVLRDYVHAYINISGTSPPR
jgi:hypothetical protein